MKKIHGETHIYNFDSVEEWRNSILPSILGKFSLNDIFNCDETGLFFKKLSLRTYEKKKRVLLEQKLSMKEFQFYFVQMLLVQKNLLHL